MNINYKIRTFLDVFRYGIPNFLRNLWLFRKALWGYRAWDYSGMLHFMEISSRDMSELHRKHGIAVKSEQSAEELLVFSEIMKRLAEDDYIKDKLDFDASKGFNECFTQKQDVFPRYKGNERMFYKMTEAHKVRELEYAMNLMRRKLFTWWD